MPKNQKNLFLAFFALIILILAVGGTWYYLQSQTLVTPPVVVQQVTDLSPADIEIYKEIENRDEAYSILDFRYEGGYGPDLGREFGVYLGNEWEIGVNLSQTILKSYFTHDPNDTGRFEPTAIEKDGSDIYFTSMRDHAVYKVAVKEKKVVRLYENRNYTPSGSDILIKDNFIYTGWSKDPENTSENGFILAIDITNSKPPTLYPFKIPDTYFDRILHREVVKTVDRLVFDFKDDNLLIVLPRFKEVIYSCKGPENEPAKCSDDQIQPFPVVNILSGIVEYRTNSEVNPPFGEQPYFEEQ